MIAHEGQTKRTLDAAASFWEGVYQRLRAHLHIGNAVGAAIDHFDARDGFTAALANQFLRLAAAARVHTLDDASTDGRILGVIRPAVQIPGTDVVETFPIALRAWILNIVVHGNDVCAQGTRAPTNGRTANGRNLTSLWWIRRAWHASRRGVIGNFCLVEIGREVNPSDASWRRVGYDRLEAIRWGAIAHKRPQDSLNSTTC